MQRMNERTVRHLGLRRRELFEKVERAALNGLPTEEWEFAEWGRARVNLDYHIEVQFRDAAGPRCRAFATRGERAPAATQKRRSVTAGSRRFRSATARTPSWSTGSASARRCFKWVA